MKSYCKGLEITPAFVHAALKTWKTGEAGRKNRWRIAKEYGSEANLVREIIEDIKWRTLHFDAIKTQSRIDENSGKIRKIGIEPIKQQVCGYVVFCAIEELINAKTGHWQVSREGMGQFRAAKSAQKAMNNTSFHAHCDISKCYDSTSCSVV